MEAIEEIHTTITIKTIRPAKNNFKTSTLTKKFKLGERVRITNHLRDEFSICGIVIRILKNHTFLTIKDGNEQLFKRNSKNLSRVKVIICK